MGLQKFQKNILKATHNLEFSAVLVFPDSGIPLDIRVSVPTILVLIIFCETKVYLHNTGCPEIKSVLRKYPQIAIHIFVMCKYVRV